MSQNINLIPADPELSDVLNYLAKDIKLTLNCHHIGTIQTFNALTQTATVSINYTKTFLQLNSIGQTSITTPSYPNLMEVPVMFLGGGTSSLTFPVSPGDECLLLFNDRDLDNWFAGSNSSAPNTGRLHSFTDAIALVGIRSLPNSLIDFDTSAASLNNATSSVKVFPAEVKATVGSNTIDLTPTSAVVTVGSNSIDVSESSAVITVGTNTINVGESSIAIQLATGPTVELSGTTISINNGAANLNTILQGIATQLEMLAAALEVLTVPVPSLGVSGIPVNAASFVAFSLQITTLATELSTLLS